MAKELAMEENRVAVGGSNYMKKMAVSDEEVFGPEYATPIGIALTAAKSGGQDFFTITFNKEQTHLPGSWDTSILGILQSKGYRYDQIIGRAGRVLSYRVNGERRIVRGGPQKQARIIKNGEPSTLYERVQPGDVVTFIPATQGKDAVLLLSDLLREEGCTPYTVFLDEEQVAVIP